MKNSYKKDHKRTEAEVLSSMSFRIDVYSKHIAVLDYLMTEDDQVNDAQLRLIDLVKLKDIIYEAFEYLSVLKRFNDLNELYGNSTTCYDGKFHVQSANFDTLNEVERALKQKALL